MGELPKELLPLPALNMVGEEVMFGTFINPLETVGASPRQKANTWEKRKWIIQNA